MAARWASFAVGIGLLLAPLVLGYGSAAPVLHDVAMGTLACIATLAALERPRARFVAVPPALWLVASAPSASDADAAVADLVAGTLLLALATVPSARLAPRPLPPVSGGTRAGARA
jgi:hypothetical protein